MPPPKSHRYSSSWNGRVVQLDTVADASKCTPNGATPDVRETATLGVMSEAGDHVMYAVVVTDPVLLLFRGSNRTVNDGDRKPVVDPLVPTGMYPTADTCHGTVAAVSSYTGM